MKKNAILLILSMIISLSLTSCETTTTNQHNNSNYFYELNEEAQITDKDSNDKLGTLKFTRYHILKDTPFTVHELNGEDENGNPRYKDVQYEQLIQLNYVYHVSDSTKKPDSSHFGCWDSLEKYCTMNPSDIKYTPASADGEHSFVIAVPTKSNYIKIGYRYAFWQVTGFTAQFKIEIK